MSAPPRPRSALAASILFLCAALFLTFTLVRLRLERRPVPSPPPSGAPAFGGTWLTASDHDGLEVTPGRGHTLFVDSTPSAASVLLDGTVTGETPYAADFGCTEGKHRMLEVKLAGYQSARYQLDCVEGATHVNSKLRRR